VFRDVFRTLRRIIEETAGSEPEWRTKGRALATGYQSPWPSGGPGDSVEDG
jgi:hypothetical protein